MKPPKSLSEKGAADWERFVFHVETFLALMDDRYPEYLDEARRSQKPCAMEGMAFDYRMLSIKLFGLITSWTQDAPSAVKIARGIQGQNGFELWRVLWREYHPEQTNESLIWRRTSERCCPQNLQHARQISAQRFKKGKIMSIAMPPNSEPNAP